MNTSFLMTLRPLEPYFFGNEKTFLFDPGTVAENRYFIKSERFPAQTTLLGALRYTLMPVKHADFRYTEEELHRNGLIVGRESFDLEKEGQTFGAIARLDPVFLTFGAEKYIPTPLDHNLQETTCYRPFRDYRTVETERGQQWYTPEFRTKDGLTDSFMNVESGQLLSYGQVFDSQLRVGVNKGKQTKGFYKKQFSVLKEGWAFAAYVALDTVRIQADPAAETELDKLKAGTVVYLGQSKSAFLLQLIPEQNTIAEQIAVHLHPNAVYCFGDMIADPAVYNSCWFAAVRQRDHRTIVTSFSKGGAGMSGQIAKREKLYKLICSGSVFLVDEPQSWKKQLENTNVQTIGFQVCVTNKEV